ncbi:MAG TPA: hypothetical protein VEM96_18230 [Pyrinomonadaceae bacterium]|nr:hypothetical protein [Pyrinomonadaceae bacterium]
MQTITVAQIHQRPINTDRFATQITRTNIRRQLSGEDRFEELRSPFVERLQLASRRLQGLVTAVIRRRHPSTVVTTSIENGYLERIEAEEVVEDFTRVWVGHRNYALFCFLAGFPGGTYPGHRLLVAQSLTQDALNDEQQLVSAVGYDLYCVRQRFGTNVWDQNFRRTDAIRRGRIRGTAMQSDPLYPEFQQIETFIGVEIPITGSQQMVKVFSDGRLQFMGLQPLLIENPTTREAALDTIIQVLDSLQPCKS